MSRRFILLCLGSLLAIAGCRHEDHGASRGARGHYVVGAPWHDGNSWFYPHEEASYHATGLAIVDTPAAGRSYTADGEPYDPERLAASHQTLQLPSVVSVRNLENGRILQLKLDDRGPGNPGRLISLTPRAAAMLAIRFGTPTRVEITLEPQPTIDLLSTLPGAPVADVTPAPVEQVQEQSLDAGRPPGVADPARALVPERPPPAPVLTSGPSAPGRLWVELGQFSQSIYAREVARRLAASIRIDGRGRATSYDVRMGPYDLVHEADAALDRARSAGVTGAHITVE